MMRGPYVQFTPHGSSTPFLVRKCKAGGEEDPIKIGRAVARMNPAVENALFDCKVLSRNHAVIYYEDGAFYIKDTKSSNGTFLNNSRLSCTGEESSPKRIATGDVVQFGVDIQEGNGKTANVTHGCIFATIRMFDECGKEIFEVDDGERKPRLQSLTNSQLYKLQQYLNEAFIKERGRMEKLTALTEEIKTIRNKGQETVKKGREEQRLLMRIQALENVLSIPWKNPSPEKTRLTLLKLKEEHFQIMQISQEELRKSQEANEEMKMRSNDLERAIESMEEEMKLLKQKISAIENSEENVTDHKENEESVQALEPQSDRVLTDITEQEAIKSEDSIVSDVDHTTECLNTAANVLPHVEPENISDLYNIKELQKGIYKVLMKAAREIHEKEMIEVRAEMVNDGGSADSATMSAYKENNGAEGGNADFRSQLKVLIAWVNAKDNDMYGSEESLFVDDFESDNDEELEGYTERHRQMMEASDFASEIVEGNLNEELEFHQYGSDGSVAREQGESDDELPQLFGLRFHGYYYLAFFILLLAVSGTVIGLMDIVNVILGR